MGLEGGVGWLLGGGGCPRRWREAWRLSLKEVLSLTHQEAELQWREELQFLAGRRSVADALRSRSDVCLLPCFRAAVLGGQEAELLLTLDQSESTSCDRDVTVMSQRWRPQHQILTFALFPQLQQGAGSRGRSLEHSWAWPHAVCHASLTCWC